MAHTNESIPEWAPRMQIDELRFHQLEMERKFWNEKYCSAVKRLENMVDSCKEYGYVELTWGSKKFKFTMEEIK